jgi:hypothetical protein
MSRRHRIYLPGSGDNLIKSIHAPHSYFQPQNGSGVDLALAEGTLLIDATSDRGVCFNNDNLPGPASELSDEEMKMLAGMLDSKEDKN